MQPTNRHYLATALAVAALLGLAVVPAGAVPVVGNAGFETDTYTVAPGYSAAHPPGITAWTESSGTGINPGPTSPFANNGTIPEGTQVAFIQTSGTLSQSVSGFTAGNRYVVRLRTNARGGNTAQLEIDLGGSNVLPTTPVTAVGTTQAYRSATSGIFTAIGTAHTVALRNATVPDNTLLLDAVEIVDLGASGPVLLNGGFEDVALNPSTFIKGASVSDFHIGTWAFGGAGAGISRNISAFQNGGLTASEGQQIGVLQNAATITQTIQGLTAGEAYTITLDNVARNSALIGNDLRVVVDGQTLLGGQVQDTTFGTTTSAAFVATGPTASLVLQSTNPQGGDRTTFVDDVQVNSLGVPSGPTLVNPGFEADTFTNAPGYVSTNRPVSGWIGTDDARVGINPGGGSPFADNGAIPEGSQVGLVQSIGSAVSLSQTAVGLTPGERYVVIYRENARSTNTAFASTTFDGSVIVAGHNVTPVGGANQYVPVVSMPFTATAASGALTFTNNTATDNTLLVDAVQFLQVAATGPVVVNPSFEFDTFTTFPGYVNGAGNGQITGWASNNTNSGINPGGGSPFANNGAIPDGSQVAFLQANGFTTEISQTIHGFEGGENYIVTYRENTRGGQTVDATTTLGGTTVVGTHAVTSVGGSNPYRYVGSDVFTASSTAHDLLFRATSGVDSTLLVDDVAIKQIYLNFGDNFNALANSNDINPGTNDQLPRQTGQLGTLNYVEQGTSGPGAGGSAPFLSQVDNGEYPDALLLAAQSAGGGNPTTVSPDYNFAFEQPGGTDFVIEFDVDPARAGNIDPSPALASSWSAVVFGSSNQTASVNTSDGVGLLIRGTGGYQIFDGTSGSNILETSGDLGDNFGIDESGFYGVRVNYFVPTFDDVTAGLVGIFVDDILIHSFTPDSGFDENFIVLVGNTDAPGALITHGFDNLQVWSTAFVPEPGTGMLVMLGLVGLFTDRRRRK